MVEELPGIGFLAGALAALLGGVFIIAGLVAFLLAYGFWTGRGWAWILGIIFSIVGIVLGADGVGWWRGSTWWRAYEVKTQYEEVAEWWVGSSLTSDVTGSMLFRRVAVRWWSSATSWRCLRG
jgi:hypothetical protein